MRGFAILLGFNLLGVLVQSLLNIPLPGNVIGLIIFIAALFLRIIKLEWVEASAQFLMRHMLLFFAPLIVGVILFFPLFSEQWMTLIISLLVSTCVVIIVSGWVTRLLERAETEGEQVG